MTPKQLGVMSGTPEQEATPPLFSTVFFLRDTTRIPTELPGVFDDY